VGKPPNRVIALAVLVLPIVLLSAVALFALPRIAGLPGLLATPLTALFVLSYTSLLAATLELGARIALHGWPGVERT
jgi:hypothetical protein